MAAQRTTGSRSGKRRAGGDEARSAILAEIATLYWVDRWTQEQIAKQIGRSVPTVSRLLAEAEATGIVEVRVRHPSPVAPDVQAELTRRFGLRVARVLAPTSDDPGRVLALLGELAARYLAVVLADGMTISVGWGTSLYETVQALRPAPRRGVRVAQALGSLGSKLPAIDNHLIARLLADRVGGTAHFLPAPMIVESEAVREALVQDPQVRETLALGRRSDLSLTGIGVAAPDLAGMYRAGYIDDAQLRAIQEAGAVGDILVGFFDERGRRLDLEVSRRVVGLTLDDLRAVPSVVAVAGGVRKAPAILGALRLGLIHVLVTDQAAARRVIELDDADPAPVMPRASDRAPPAPAGRADSANGKVTGSGRSIGGGAAR